MTTQISTIESTEISNGPSEPPPAPASDLAIWDEQEAGRLAERFENAPLKEILRWSLERWGSDLALVSSFQIGTMVILDAARREGLKPRVMTLDTGRLPAETYKLIDTVRERYDVEVEVFFPKFDAVEEMVREKGANLFYESIENRVKCCQVRKVEPLKRALSGVEAWITGLRRQQSPTRTAIGKVEFDETYGGIAKINPIADWTYEQVWAYVREHKVPYHSFYDRGFTSIGCQPCTRAVAEGEGLRSGRWWWENNGSAECGLHWNNGHGQATA